MIRRRVIDVVDPHIAAGRLVQKRRRDQLFVVIRYREKTASACWQYGCLDFYACRPRIGRIGAAGDSDNGNLRVAHVDIVRV